MAEWSYRGRWALITGASSGIGEAFARALAARGMNVVLVARREERLRALADELRSASGVEATSIAADLGEPGSPERVWDAIGACPVHLLVNNAGFGLQGRYDQLPRERQRAMIDLNCGAVLELARLALPSMRERAQGGIINVASVAAFQPIPRLATYAATKTFVLALSTALQEENRDVGVRVVALCPGTVPTEFQQVAGFSRSRRMPGARTPEEVVRAALQTLERGGGVVVPGGINRASALLARLMPISWATRIAGAAMRRIDR